MYLEIDESLASGLHGEVRGLGEEPIVFDGGPARFAAAALKEDADQVAQSINDGDGSLAHDSEAQKEQSLVAHQVLTAQFAHQSKQIKDQTLKDQPKVGTLIKQKTQAKGPSLPSFF